MTQKIEEAKRLYQTANADQRYVLESLFPELKDEDERIRENIIATIHLYYGEPLEDEAKEMIAWLEKQAQKPAAWSEEEEKNFKKAIKVLKVTNFHHTADMLQEMKYKLISREKTNWKPSDEQIEVLLSEVTAWTKGCPKQTVLESLYQDLKKLREDKL